MAMCDLLRGAGGRLARCGGRPAGETAVWWVV